MSKLFYYPFHAMGSPCQIQFYVDHQAVGQDVFQRVMELLTRLEKKYSRYRKDSLLSVINNAAGSGQRIAVDSETVTLLHYAQQCFIESDGLFDVTSGTLRKIWDFSRQQAPDINQIDGILPLIGWNKVEWDEQAIYLPLTGMELDFGGIVKEYAADAVANLCLQMGIHSGVIELGGDVRVLGAQPDGQGWPVAIRDPHNTDQTVTKLDIKQGALASSGDYERYLELNGIRYSHLLNPNTGWPVSGLRAVSVITEHCIVAGSLATIAMLKGNEGVSWLQQQELPFMCCLSNGQIIQQLH